MYLLLSLILSYYVLKYAIKRMYSWALATLENDPLMVIEQQVVLDALCRGGFQNMTFPQAKRTAYGCNMMASYAFYANKGINPYFFYHVVTKMIKTIKDDKVIFETLDSYQMQLTLPVISYWYGVKKCPDVKRWKIPKTNESADIISSLLAFLFEKYPVPAPLRNAWFSWNCDENKSMSILLCFTEKDFGDVQIADNVLFNWYFTVAEGGNLRKHKNLPFSMSKNAAAYFNTLTDSEMSLLQAWRWSKAKALGADDYTAKLLAAELPFFDERETYIEEITYFLMRSTRSDYQKKKEAVRFLKVLAMNEFCFEYAGFHAFFMLNLMPNFSLKGKNVASVLRMKERVIKQLPKVESVCQANLDWICLQKTGDYEFEYRNFTAFITRFSSNKNENFAVWNIASDEKTNIVASIKEVLNGTFLDALSFRLNVLMALQEVPVLAYPSVENTSDFFEYYSEKGTIYEVVRLRDYLELYEEGLALQHCVAEYDKNCLDGSSSIWSLRERKSSDNFTRLITIQWHLEDISQACGYENNDPNDFEQAIIEQWKIDMLSRDRLRPVLSTKQAMSETALPV